MLSIQIPFKREHATVDNVTVMTPGEKILFIDYLQLFIPILLLFFIIPGIINITGINPSCKGKDEKNGTIRPGRCDVVSGRAIRDVHSLGTLFDARATRMDPQL
ncbi:hypothetical protein SDC9_211708 [bioreactor metagenome]|uniref:Uncharacterized protein n=1 Tax=bioreactor metagenome TaxID=1076179 RepID=A0A645JK25_9ZZZZ